MRVTWRALLPVVLALVSLGLVSDARAGVDGCIGPSDACEDPCPIVLCDTDEDCPGGEVCVTTGPSCCTSSYCECLPETGEWICTADCATGAQVCKPPGNPACVPALSEAGVALLAVLMLAVLTIRVIRKRKAGLISL